MPWSSKQYIVLAAGCDFILTAIFFYFYRQKRHLWNAVKSATLIAGSTDRQELAKLLYGEDGGERKSVYVVVDGEIEASEPSRKGDQPQVITSQYRPDSPFRGVYRLVSSEERYLRRAAGSWYDDTNTVRQDVGHVPACIVVNLPSEKAQHEKLGANQSESSLLSPATWVSMTVSSSKYIWKATKPIVMYVPRLFSGGEGEKSGEKSAGNAAGLAPPRELSVPKNQLVFTLPPLNLVDQSILRESCLTLLHSDFEPKNHNIVESFSQVIFGNIFLGTTHRESLLLCGTRVFVFANLDPIKAALTSSPSSGSYRLTLSSRGGDEVPFIITCLTPEQLASRLKTPVIVYGVLSLIGFGVLCALAAKWWYDRREGRQVASNARQMRNEAMDRRRQKLQAAGEQPDNDSSFDVDSMCVICLDSRRDVALMPCGHVCMCANCYARLPSATCPLCRGEVTGTTPLFFS